MLGRMLKNPWCLFRCNLCWIFSIPSESAQPWENRKRPTGGADSVQITTTARDLSLPRAVLQSTMSSLRDCHKHRFTFFSQRSGLACHLTLKTYYSLLGAANKFRDFVRQSANGMSADRLKHLQSLERCRCERKDCFQKLKSIMTTLLHFLQMFWSLTKSAQDLFAAS